MRREYADQSKITKHERWSVNPVTTHQKAVNGCKTHEEFYRKVMMIAEEWTSSEEMTNYEINYRVLELFHFIAEKDK